MNEKELSIETLQVEIKVIRVGGHKMTISVFEQIHSEKFQVFLGIEDYGDFLRKIHEWKPRFLDATSKPHSEIKLLGHINRKHLYLLYTELGMLKKTEIEFVQTYGRDDTSYADQRAFRRFISEQVPQLFIAT